MEEPESEQTRQRQEDREKRIEALRKQAEEISGGSMLWGKTDHLPPEIEEEFWKQIVAYESAEPVDLFDLLAQGGVSLPPPALVSEALLPDKLWEAIYYLATVGCYLENTDHLSDRELYTLLWDELLREPAILFPDDPNYAYHIDTIGGGSEEDQAIYLKYYAREEDRRRWAEEWPDEKFPEPAPRPYDRDRHLPRPYMRRAEPLM